MKDHKTNAMKAIAILDSINKKLRALYIKHQNAQNARMKRAA